MSEELRPAPPAGARRGTVAGLAGATMVVTTAVGVVTGPLLARALGPTGRGEVAAATAYFAIASTVACLGVPMALAHSVAKRTHRPGALLGSTLRLAALEAGPSIAIGLAVVAGPLAGLSLAGRLGTFALMALVPVAVIAACLTLLVIGEGSLRPLLAIQVWPPVLTCLATVAAFLAGSLTVGAYLAITIAGVLLTAGFAFRAIGARPTSGPSLGPFVRFGLRGYAGYLASFGAIRIDQAVIGPVLGSRQLGYYAVAVTVALLPLTLARAIFSRSFAIVAEADPDHRCEAMSRYLRLTLLTVGLFCLGLGLASVVALPLLYGRAFRSSLGPLALLLPGTTILAVSGTATVCLTALGRPGQTTISELAGLAVTGVGMPIVIPQFGIMGAAVLSTTAYSATLLSNLIFLRRTDDVRVWPRLADVSSVARAGVAGSQRAFRALPTLLRRQKTTG
jgi:O-antigen/teichoic acid export membrane protein